MTDKELKKLSRLELLELLLEQSRENEQLRQDNEVYRQENEVLHSQPVVPSSFDPSMFIGFSEFAKRIDSSLTETRRATQSYIDRLAVLAESAEKSVAKAASKKPESTSLEVTEEAILPEVEEVSVTSPVTVKPLSKAKPVKKVDTKAVSSVSSVQQPSSGSKAERHVTPQTEPEAPPMAQSVYMPMGAYPIISAPVYQPVPVYYPTPVPAPVVSTPKATAKLIERREENGVTVRPLTRNKKEEKPLPSENEDSRLVSALVEFYFENPDMLEGLSEEIKKQIIIRFKR